MEQQGKSWVPLASIKVLLVWSSVFFACSCAAGAIINEDEQLQKPVKENCSDPEFVSKVLIVEPVTPLNSLSILGVEDSKAVKLVSSLRVKGQCVGELERFYSDSVQLKGPTTLSLVGQVKFVPARKSYAAPVRIGSDDPHPEIEGLAFVMAQPEFGYSYPGKGAKTFFGLWRSESQSAIVRFQQKEDGTFAVGQPVLVSPRKILDISHLPVLDANGSLIYMLQADDNGLLLNTLQWMPTE